MFFDEKANQVIFEEKQKQLKGMKISYHVYTSKKQKTKKNKKKQDL